MKKYVKLQTYGSDTYYVDAELFDEVFNRDEWAFMSNSTEFKDGACSYVKRSSSGETYMNSSGILMKIEAWHAQYLEQVSS